MAFAPADTQKINNILNASEEEQYNNISEMNKDVINSEEIQEKARANQINAIQKTQEQDKNDEKLIEFCKQTVNEKNADYSTNVLNADSQKNEDNNNVLKHLSETYSEKIETYDSKNGLDQWGNPESSSLADTYKEAIKKTEPENFKTAVEAKQTPEITPRPEGPQI